MQFTRDPSESEETLCTITPAQTVDWIAELLEIPDVDAFRMALLKAKVCNTFKVFQPDQVRMGGGGGIGVCVCVCVATPCDISAPG